MFEIINIILLIICLIGFVIGIFFVFKGKDKSEKIISAIFTITTIVISLTNTSNMHNFNEIKNYSNAIAILNNQIIELQEENISIQETANTYSGIIEDIQNSIVDLSNNSGIATVGDNNDINQTNVISPLSPKPSLKVDAVTYAHKETIENNQLNIYYDNNDNFMYGISEAWCLEITNYGNGSAKNVKITIKIDGILFEDRTLDYNVDHHISGIGGYATLEYKMNDILNPSEYIYLPKLPLEKAHFINPDKPLTNTIMLIELYAEDMKTITCSVPINISDNIELSYSEDSEEQVISSYLANFSKLNELMGSGIGIYELYNLDAYSAKLDSTKLNEYKKIYNYMLNNINADNTEFGYDIQKNIIFWGRIYYRCKLENDSNYKTKDISSDIEMAIGNDMNSVK